MIPPQVYDDRSPRQLAPKFKCPSCRGYRSHVLRGDSRGDETYRRRRQCDDCGYRFNTTERVEKSFDR
jgi:transcriptional regulator NrdR family protein